MDLYGEAKGPTARPDTSVVQDACSALLLYWRDGGKQPSTRRVTFQHSVLSNWFEEPDDIIECVKLLSPIKSCLNESLRL